MNVTRNNIILATEKIIDLDAQERRKLLLTLLGTNPTLVLRALEIGTAVKLFKVIVTDKGVNKINLIKCFRQIRGAGLADSKAWAEGESFGQWPSGVFGFDLTRFQADTLLHTIKVDSCYSGFTVGIVDNDAKVIPLPREWNPQYNAPIYGNR